MGSLRERGLRRAIEHSLPTIASLYDGEVIDPFGGQSGQLDGIIVHSTGVALATAPDDSRVVLAEGVLAVIESKSDLVNQWKEVERTWGAISPLRRWKGSPSGVVMYGGMPHASEAALPIIVIGRKGWAQESTLIGKAEALHQSFGAVDPPSTMVVQLDPPGFGLVCWANGTTVKTMGAIFGEQDRWKTLGNVWAVLTDAAQRLAMMRPAWDSYLR
jgi:hypothetical protein